MKSIQKLLFCVVLSSSPVCADEPQRLTDLRESFERESQALNESLMKKYVAALKKLQTNYAKGGDKKAASAMLKEIAKITGKTSPENTSLSVKDFTFTKWLNMVSFSDNQGVILTVTGKSIEQDKSALGGVIQIYALTVVNEKRRIFNMQYDKDNFKKIRVKSTLKSAEVIDSAQGKTKEAFIVIPERNLNRLVTDNKIR